MKKWLKRLFMRNGNKDAVMLNIGNGYTILIMKHKNTVIDLQEPSPGVQILEYSGIAPKLYNLKDCTKNDEEQ